MMTGQGFDKCLLSLGERETGGKGGSGVSWGVYSPWTAKLQQACGPGVRIYAQRFQDSKNLSETSYLQNADSFLKTLFKENIF